jgi:hypothetical protein
VDAIISPSHADLTRHVGHRGAQRGLHVLSGFSAANMTRSGAPFHGASGEGRTASSAASSQLPRNVCACESVIEKSETRDTPAISDNAFAAVAAERCALSN